jgi:hypothetical protein
MADRNGILHLAGRNDVSGVYLFRGAHLDARLGTLSATVEDWLWVVSLTLFSRSVID